MIRSICCLLRKPHGRHERDFSQSMGMSTPEAVCWTENTRRDPKVDPVVFGNVVKTIDVYYVAKYLFVAQQERLYSPELRTTR